jgi:hypothetical protein
MPVGKVEIRSGPQGVEVLESAASRRTSVILLAALAALMGIAAVLPGPGGKLEPALLGAALAAGATILGFRPRMALRAAADGSLWRNSDLAAGTGEAREIVIEEVYGRTPNYRLIVVAGSGQVELALIDTLGEARKAASALAEALGIPAREDLGPRLTIKI